MSTILTDEHINWIATHPVIQNNIKEHLRDFYKFKSDVDFQIKDMFSDFVYVKNDYLIFKKSINKQINKQINSDIKEEIPKYLLNNGEYVKIFSDNLEKLKAELTSHGEIILTTLVNDKAYQHIADTHLNSLQSKLTETYDKFIQNNSKSIEDIQKNFDNLILDVKNLKNECDNHKKYINNLENIMAINCILLGTIISISTFYGIYKLFY
jgi:hypothetical protein